MLVGGEDLPKVSTQALKQQYEKTIEEAASAKEIKVMMPPLYLDASLGFSSDDGITSWYHHVQITPAAGGLWINWFVYFTVLKRKWLLLMRAPDFEWVTFN